MANRRPMSTGMAEDQMNEQAPPAPRRKRKYVMGEAKGRAVEPGMGTSVPKMGTSFGRTGGMAAGLRGRAF